MTRPSFPTFPLVPTGPDERRCAPERREGPGTVRPTGRAPFSSARAAVAAVAAVSAWGLTACASGPRAADWQIESKAALDRANAAWLEGNSRVAQVELLRARSQLSRTGRADLMAQAELSHCATRVASVVFEPCAGFEALRADATPAQRAYAGYLRGQATPAEMALLPEAQRAVAAGGSAPVSAAVDPLSQLVAAGVRLQAADASPVVIDEAIATASAQGWRRPLLAWLGVQAQRAELAGDREEAARLRRRMDLAQDPATAPRIPPPTSAPTLPTPSKAVP